MRNKVTFFIIFIYIFFIPSIWLSASQIYTYNDIMLSTSNNLGDFLKEYAGINLFAEGDMGQSRKISMRGAGAENVLFIIDGQVMNSPSDNQKELKTIPMEFIENIEIINADPVIYGINSSGGIIKITTKKFRSKEPYSKIEISWGDFNNRIFNFNYGNQFKKFEYFLGITKHSGVGKFPYNDYKGQNILANLSYKYDSSIILNITSGFYDDNVGHLVFFDTTSLPIMSGDEDKYQKLELTKIFEEYGNINVSLSNHIVFNNFGKLDIYEEAERQDIKLNYEKKFNKYLSLVLGYEINKYLYSTILNSKELKPENNDKTYFLRTNLYEIRNIDIILGYRFYDPENYSILGVPYFDLSYRISDYLKINGYIYNDYTLPDFKDIYGDNLNQKPAKKPLIPSKSLSQGINMELGGESSQTIELKLYETNFIDFLSTEHESNSNSIYTANIKDAYSKNIEIYLKNRFLSYFASEIGYSYITAREKTSNHFLPNEPRNKITYYLIFNKDFHKGDLNIGIKFGGEKIGQSFTALDNTEELSPYTLFNAKLVIRIVDINFYWGASNMQYTKYETRKGFPMPERRVTFGFNWEFID
ncbi:MAG: TonB-dependent receptor [Candidatus Firestonebacteria bacterium]|nr:TonB-dependent receptor [Candidatus Firestonebacteria bacterium]